VSLLQARTPVDACYTPHVRCLKNTHTAVHRTQPGRTGGSSACAGQLVSKGWANNFTCAHRAAPAPAAAARQPGAGAPARRHATSSRGQDRHRSSGLASALAWVSSGAFFSQASARPSLTASWALGCPVQRVRVIGRKNLLTLRPASPAPATTAQAGALARRDSSAPPHMHCWSSGAGGSTARLYRALQLRQQGSARS